MTILISFIKESIWMLLVLFFFDWFFLFVHIDPLVIKVNLNSYLQLHFVESFFRLFFFFIQHHFPFFTEHLFYFQIWLYILQLQNVPNAKRNVTHVIYKWLCVLRNWTQKNLSFFLLRLLLLGFLELLRELLIKSLQFNLILVLLCFGQLFVLLLCLQWKLVPEQAGDLIFRIWE